jgi:hypothetical protein
VEQSAELDVPGAVRRFEGSAPALEVPATSLACSGNDPWAAEFDGQRAVLRSDTRAIAAFLACSGNDPSAAEFDAQRAAPRSDWATRALEVPATSLACSGKAPWSAEFHAQRAVLRSDTRAIAASLAWSGNDPRAVEFDGHRAALRFGWATRALEAPAALRDPEAGGARVKDGLEERMRHANSAHGLGRPSSARALFAAAAIALSACTSGEVLTTRKPPPALEVSPGVAALAPTASRVFTAQVTNSTAPVEWSASGGTLGPAEGDSGDATRRNITLTWTAPAAPGAYTLTATLRSEPPRTVTVPITVSTQLAFGMAVPVEHPRLWWNAERLARARSWLATHPFTPAATDVVGVALHALLSERPAECAPAISWALSFDLDVTPGDTLRDEGERAALVYDWCHGAFTAAQREAFRLRWNAALAPLAGDAWGGPEMPQSDVFWTRLRNHFEWGVASLGENPDAEGYLRDALEVRWRDAFVPHAAGPGLGGGLQEGGVAAARVVDSSVVLLVTARLAGRDLLAETAFFDQAVYALAAATTPAPTVLRNTSSRFFEIFPQNDEPNYVDGASGSRKEWAGFMLAMAGLRATATSGGIARSWLSLTGVAPPRFVEAADLASAPVPFDTLPVDQLVTGPAWLFARTAWSPTATVLRLQLGEPRGTGHEHLDQGSFQLWRSGAWLSRESAAYFQAFKGYAGVGTAMSETAIAHNVVLFDGKGRVHPDTDGPPVLLRLERNDDLLWVVVDLTPSYRASDAPGGPRDNPAVEHYEREFIFLRREEALVILDRLSSRAVGAKSAAQIAKTFLMHFEQQPTLEDATHVRMTQADQVVRLTTLAPAAPARRVVDEGGEGQFRLEVETSGAADGHLLHVIQGSTLGAADRPVSMVEDAARFVVTVGTSTLTLEKGTRTSGGAWSIAGGASGPLPARVRQLTADATGMAWLP